MRRLLIRPGAIGDCICSLPALESLAVGETEVWVASPNVPLIRFANRVRSIASTGLDWLEIDPARAPSSLVDLLRRFDSIVSWYGAARPEFRDAVARLRLPFEFLTALPPAADVHAVDFYLGQARSLGGREVAPVPVIPCERRAANRIVIHPFASSPAKTWALDKFRAVAEKLGSTVRWTAGPTESLPGADRFDDLYELACWLAGACLYIGNDTGITHLAAAVGAPVVAIFGPTDDRIWAPRGPSVRIVKPPHPADPIEAIAPAAVLEAAHALGRRPIGP